MSSREHTKHDQAEALSGISSGCSYREAHWKPHLTVAIFLGTILMVQHGSTFFGPRYSFTRSPRYLGPVWNVPILFQIDISPVSRNGPTPASTITAVPSHSTLDSGGLGSSTIRWTLGSRARK